MLSLTHYVDFFQLIYLNLKMHINKNSCFGFSFDSREFLMDVSRRFNLVMQALVFIYLCFSLSHFFIFYFGGYYI